MSEVTRFGQKQTLVDSCALATPMRSIAGFAKAHIPFLSLIVKLHGSCFNLLQQKPGTMSPQIAIFNAFLKFRQRGIVTAPRGIAVAQIYSDLHIKLLVTVFYFEPLWSLSWL